LAETTVEFVRRHLDSEMQSEGLHPLPADFYVRLSQYNQKLRRSGSAGVSEVAVRLIARQVSMIESMLTQLFETRARKAAARNSYHMLLPEERYVCSMQQSFTRRRNALLQAVSAGRPSFVDFAHRTEASRSVTVRFVKGTGEFVGSDLRRYGPYETNDVASIPAANADILIAGGEALEVYTRDEL
jgi:DNA replication factor GINS